LGIEVQAVLLVSSYGERSENGLDVMDLNEV